MFRSDPAPGALGGAVNIGDAWPVAPAKEVQPTSSGEPLDGHTVYGLPPTAYRRTETWIGAVRTFYINSFRKPAYVSAPSGTYPTSGTSCCAFVR